jgi:hypothetical protein
MLSRKLTFVDVAMLSNVVHQEMYHAIHES